MARHRFSNLVLVSWASLLQGPAPTNLGLQLQLQKGFFFGNSSSRRCDSSSLCHQKRCCSTTRRSLAAAPGDENHNNNNDNDRQPQPQKNLSLSLPAQEAFSILAKRGKTWRRMKHLVILVQEAQAQQKTLMLLPNSKNHLNTIVDIGTDHGLLPIALAVSPSGQFQKITGVDVSERVLRDGAWALYQEVRERIAMVIHPPDKSSEQDLFLSNLEFCCGDGLAKMEPGHADIVCIAGMGVNTMLKIITPSELDRTRCQVLVLQPTNSKPRNLIRLYNQLQQQQQQQQQQSSTGWQLVDERIEMVSSRWYISASFARRARNKSDHIADDLEQLETTLPGTKLKALNTNDEMNQVFQEYVKHHCTWLERDKNYQSGLTDDEYRWYDAFCK